MTLPLTIEEAIQYGLDEPRGHRQLNEMLRMQYSSNGIIIASPINPITSKYKDFLEKYLLKKVLTEEEAYMYRYSPKKLSLDLYGTVAYWSLILFINDCHSILEFEPTEIVYVDPYMLESVLDEISILEANNTYG